MAFLRQLVIFLWLGLMSLATHADIESGFAWLSSQQQADGSFSTTNDIATEFQATSEALNAFATQTSPPQTVSALDFLQSDTVDNTEYLSRKIISHQALGEDVAQWITQLKTQANDDGGYGEYKRYQSTILDTAYALQALAIGGEGSSQEAGSAVGFLLERQQADGSLIDDEENVLYSHIMAMHALWHYRHLFSTVPTAVDRAKQYLLQQQNNQGLWDETFIDALALLALIPTYDNTESLVNSIEALRLAQLSNGSFDDDVFTTALVLQVLALMDSGQTNPDLGQIGGEWWIVKRDSQLTMRILPYQATQNKL